MTLNDVMVVAMRYFTEFGSFPGALPKSGCSGSVADDGERVYA